MNTKLKSLITINTDSCVTFYKRKENGILEFEYYYDTFIKNSVIYVNRRLKTINIFYYYVVKYNIFYTNK